MTNLPIKREQRKISDLIHKPENVNPHETWDTNFKYIDISSINRSKFTIENPKSILGKNAPSRAKRKIRKWDILFATTRPNLKNIAICWYDCENIVASTGFCILRVKEEIENKFLFYYITSNLLQKKIKKFIKWAQYPAISDKNFKSIQIPLPPLSTQKAILAKLDEISASIQQAKSDIEKQIEKVDELWMSELDNQLNWGYKLKKLWSICWLQNWFAFSSKKFKDHWIPIIRISNLQSGIISFKRIVYCDIWDYDKDLSKYIIKKWNLLIAMSWATTWKLAIYNKEEEWLLNQRVWLFKCDNKITKKYLYLYLSTKIQYNLNQSAGSAIPNLSTKQIKEIEIPFPLIQKQQSIVSHLNKLHEHCKSLKNNYQSQLTNYDQLRASTLDQAFSGKLAV
jgi:type I restriction enzyme S subunit